MNVDQVADAIFNAGYEVAFGIIGSGPSYSLVSALVKRGVKFHLVSNESAAAIAAGTYSYHFHSKALAISIKGPGFVNLLSGIAACFLENFDMLAISEEYDDSTSIYSRHKRLDQQKMMDGIVKKKSTLNADTLDVFLNDSLYNPGPKYLSLAKRDDIWEAPIVDKKELSTQDLKKILDLIDKSERLLLIIGSVFYRLELVYLLNNIHVPLMTSVQGKGVVNENEGNVFGIYTGVGLKLVPENDLIETADLVLTIGLKNEEILGVDEKHKFLNIDLNPQEYDQITHKCSLIQLDQILNSLKSKNNWADSIKLKYDQLKTDYLNQNSWLPAQIFEELNKFSQPSTLVLDTGFFCTVGEHIYLANNEKRFIGSSNGRNMGLSVPMSFAIGIKGNPVFCCFGDGGIRYHLGEIRTIAEMQLPVCFILFSDGKYGSVSAYVGNEQANEGLTKPLGTTWMDVFEAMGIQSYSVKNKKDFEDNFKTWDSKSPVFFEALFEENAYSKMTSEIRK